MALETTGLTVDQMYRVVYRSKRGGLHHEFTGRLHSFASEGSVIIFKMDGGGLWYQDADQIVAMYKTTAEYTSEPRIQVTEERVF